MTTKVTLSLGEIEACFGDSLRQEGFTGKIMEVLGSSGVCRSFRLGDGNAAVFWPPLNNEPVCWFVEAVKRFLGHRFVGTPTGFPDNVTHWTKMTITVEGGPGGDATLTELRWANRTLTAEDIFAAIDKMSSDEMFAEAAAHVKEAILNGNCDIDCLADEAEELAAETLREFVEDNPCGVRCYVAMIRCRDRAVAEDHGACGCFKSMWPACPSCGDGPGTDPCFVCQECGAELSLCDCGAGHDDMRLV